MRLKISPYAIMAYVLFAATFKPYFLPEYLRVTLKIFLLIAVLAFILVEIPRRRVLNYSLLFCASVLVSGIAGLAEPDYNMRNFLNSLLYALTFYDIYTFCQLCYVRGKNNILRRSLFHINFLYCLITVIAILILGTEDNSNRAAYPFGNKFESMYLFFLLVALFGASHDMDRKNNKIALICLFLFAIALSLYVECATASVAMFGMLVFYFLPDKVRSNFLRPFMVCFLLVMSAVVVIWIKMLLELDFVDKIVTGFFHKSYTVTGRLQVYGIYLVQAILSSFWLGHGYSNTFIYSASGVFANAQNGLMELFVDFGLIGTVIFVMTVYHCYKNGRGIKQITYLSFVVLGLIIAAIFEVSINWSFIFGITLVRWNAETDKKVPCSCSYTR